MRKPGKLWDFRYLGFSLALASVVPWLQLGLTTTLDNRSQLRWASFMKAMPDTANVRVQDIVFEGLGGIDLTFRGVSSSASEPISPSLES